jgi:hypothetical protein
MLLSYLRRFCGLKSAADINSLTDPIECHNLHRVLEHIMIKYSISYDTMDKKEGTMMDKISMLTSSRVFIEAA